MEYYAAFDLGASGGRLMLGGWDGNVITLTEVHRFANEPVTLSGVMYWDLPRLYFEMTAALKKAAAYPLKSVGIDSWGVDYGLLDARGQLISLPVHYRDARTLTHFNNPILDMDGVYSRTGIQNMNINTLYQLQSDYAARPELMNAARHLLFIPDLLSFFLSGEKVTEYTIASTSQLLNAHTRNWDDATFAGAFPEAARALAGEITSPCTVIGGLSIAVTAETGINNDCRVVAVGGHDTASAVAATPLSDERSAYLSCGTWSLLGMELDAPCMTEKSRELNFTNEGGLAGKIRYLKNINGLWMIQQLRKSQRTKLTFAEISRMAEEAKRAHFIIEPNDASFANPPDMYTAVRDYCASHGQGEIETLGEAAAAIYNGLTHEYADVISQLETVLDKKIDTLHIVGGGIQDKFLCRQTAKRIGRTVIAGPVEASALGNILAQMIGLGAISNLNEGRDIIRRSFTPEIYA